MTARFATRRALVTGGASGIGLACGRALRAQGAAVALLDRDPAVAAVAADIGATALEADVADEAQVPAAVAGAARDLGGPPDLLVSAAGVYRIAPLLELDAPAWEEVLAVNLRGSFLVGREVARGLLGTGDAGAIVNLGSTAAFQADAAEPGAHYNASKAAVLALTRQMAVEWGPRIRVNAVCPGVIDTPMLRLTDDPAAAEDYLRRRVVLRRLGAPEEVAATILFLLSGEASYITGAAVLVDGGVTST